MVSKQFACRVRTKPGELGMLYTDPEAAETERAGFRFAKLAAHGAVRGMNQRETLIILLSALNMFE